ncbi:hypothetical protein [Bradyrhizobium sp.]|uniref:hypothetical protein n=1 Tax=Bradyrhizobium sp. TaxID=376 RepID=UPI002388BE9A|nr:hypothetical protein [Bradyrhizobium sp.]MDE1935423.1 hypothetical protein [Bradyrhizobium sp.]
MIDATSGVDDEAQRRFHSAAASCGREEAAAESNAHYRQSPRQKVARQAQFRAEARHQMTADNAKRPSAEKHQTGVVFGGCGNRAAGGEGPTIAEANVSAFEVILHQTEVISFEMLQDAQCLHGHRGTSGKKNIATR